MGSTPPPHGEGEDIVWYPDRKTGQRVMARGGLTNHSNTTFDGDTGSGTGLMTDEALAENKRFLGTRQAWVSADGRLRASVNYNTIELTVLNITGRFKYADNVAVPAVL